MKKKRSAWVVLLFTITATILLNTRIGSVPPIGKLLDPLQGLWQNAETKAVHLPPSLTVPALKEKVALRLDQDLIPHITAQNDLDLYFAQGYITAFHRLWQMDFLTYAAAGRLAEIVGRQALDFDRLQRRKGNLYAAQNALTQIEKDNTLHKMVQAYVAGVNAYIHSIDYKNLPIEYKLLDYSPEAWTPLKVALMMVQMMNGLGAEEDRVARTNAFHHLGKAKFDFLFPPYLEPEGPVALKKTTGNFTPIAGQTPSRNLPYQPKQPSATHTSRAIGGNNWAVASQKTAARTPYLANDLHLTMQLPSLWYGIHLHSPTVHVFGASIPGLPGVVVGFNEAIAWGITNNAARDAKDWYLIEFKDDTRREYYYDNLLLKTQPVTEAIKVRGGATFYDTVVYTHFGPVVYDADFLGQQGQTNLAMKWLGHHPGQELLAFYLLNRAKNFQEFEQALQHYEIPSQNFSFASVSKDIAMQAAGRFPTPCKDQGRLIMPGNTAAYEWPGLIPHNHNPKILNPASGYVSSAEQLSTEDQHAPYHYGPYQEEYYRNRRAQQVFSSLKAIDEQAMMKLQNDNYNLAAQESLPWLLQYVATSQLNAPQQAAYQLLLEWDFCDEVDQLAPSVFRAWQDALQSKLWRSLQNKAWPTPDFYRTMVLLKHHPNSPYLDLGAYANLGALVHAAFVGGVQALEVWQATYQKPYRWGDYRRVFINHLARIPSFGVDNLQIDGGAHTLNAEEGAQGASMRLIVKLDKQPHGWFIYPGGQSGNPGSPYYTNLIAPWCQGHYIPVSLQNPTKPTDEACMLTPKLLRHR